MATQKDNYRDHAIHPRRHIGRMRLTQIGVKALHMPRVAFAGSFLTTPTEAEVITGTQTITLTLTESSWPATLTDAMKQNIIDTILSYSGEPAGWNAKLRAVMETSTVVRTNATVVTVTLPAAPAYKITADEVLVIGVGPAALKGSPKLPPGRAVIANTSGSDITAALTGTFLTTPTEGEVVSGGQTIIITLTNGTWVASGATFNAQRQAIINGLTSDGAAAGGWNATVRDVMAVTAVARTSNVAVTVTLPATEGYSIEEEETVTVTIPASAMNLADAPVVAGDVIAIQPD